jgi:hypothetical protein
MSWDLGFVVVMFLGFAVGAVAARTHLGMIRYLMIGVCPFIIAWGLYWIPTLWGGSSSEYANWAPIFVYPWALAAYALALVGFIVIRWRSGLKRNDNS